MPTAGRTLTQHRKTAVSFRDVCLLRVVRVALATLDQLRPRFVARDAGGGELLGGGGDGGGGADEPPVTPTEAGIANQAVGETEVVSRSVAIAAELTGKADPMMRTLKHELHRRALAVIGEPLPR